MPELNEVFQIAYVSEASEDFLTPMIDDILVTSRANNLAKGITGLLIYRGGTFVQYLEGDRARVEQLFERIKKDKRHKNVRAAYEGFDNHQLFKNWSMAYRKSDDYKVDILDKIDGFLVKATNSEVLFRKEDVIELLKLVRFQI